MIREIADLTLRVRSMSVGDILDVLLVATLIYALLYLVQGTRAVQLVKGVVLFLAPIIILFINAAELIAFNAILQNVLLPSLLVAIPVIFQPELRRAIERLGRTRLLLNRTFGSAAEEEFVRSIASAARRLSASRFGALIVLERETGLGELVERGVALDARITTELLLQIFHPNTPLHDGAIIVSHGRIAAARVVIPLGETHDRQFALGTRHLAATEVSASTDAIAVVVSEETGTISLARDGRLTRHLDEMSLIRILGTEFRAQPSPVERARLRIMRTLADTSPSDVGAPDAGAERADGSEGGPRRPAAATEPRGESAAEGGG